MRELTKFKRFMAFCGTQKMQSAHFRYCLHYTTREYSMQCSQTLDSSKKLHFKLYIRE